MLSAFGIGFFYRVVLPGILTVILLAPVRPTALLTWAGLVNVADKTSVFFVAVLGCGLVLSSARHFIYYWLEGFYWTPWSDWARRRLERRIREVDAELKAIEKQKQQDQSGEPPEKARLREFHLNQFLADFPVSTAGARPTYIVERPTRIGNAIAAYELYAEDRYGFDGVFYWAHIRFSASTSTQAELDRCEALADGMVFCAFVGELVALVYACILVGRFTGVLLATAGVPDLLMSAPAPDTVLFVFFLVSIAAFAGFSRLALFALRSFGKQIRAAIDLAVPTIVTLAEPWLPNEVQRLRLAARQDYLSSGFLPRAPTSAPRDDGKSALPTPPDD